jgi:hypothetical protein
LNNACRKKGCTGNLPTFFAEAVPQLLDSRSLIEHHRVAEKIRADTPTGELNLQDIENFSDQPIARGVGDTAADAIKTMWPLQWRVPRNG